MPVVEAWEEHDNEEDEEPPIPVPVEDEEEALAYFETLDHEEFQNLSDKELKALQEEFEDDQILNAELAALEAEEISPDEWLMEQAFDEEDL